MNRFFEETLIIPEDLFIKDEKASIKLDDLYSYFKKSYREIFPEDPYLSKSEVKDYYTKIWGEPFGSSWKIGMRLVDYPEDEDAKNNIEDEQTEKLNLFCELRSINIDELKDKCKKIGIKGFSKLKKDDLVDYILDYLYKLKNDELKSICKQHTISGYSSMKKSKLVSSILSKNSTNEEALEIIKRKKELLEMEEKVIHEKLEQERLEQERLERELLEQEHLEQERLEREHMEQERLERERLEQEQLEQEQLKEKSELDSKIEKKGKKKIPKAVKTHVWNLYIGSHINEHRCLCCKKALIKITDFETGHVISEAEGGTMEISNLRPICSVCNYSMGTMNMIEYVKKYGFYI